MNKYQELYQTLEKSFEDRTPLHMTIFFFLQYVHKLGNPDWIKQGQNPDIDLGNGLSMGCGPYEHYVEIDGNKFYGKQTVKDLKEWLNEKI